MHHETTTLLNAMGRAVESIGEHADSVLILVSTNDPNGGYAFAEMGVGNPFAHEGLVREWLRRKEDELFWGQEPPTKK
jgi:hypothetical protein